MNWSEEQEDEAEDMETMRDDDAEGADARNTAPPGDRADRESALETGESPVVEVETHGDLAVTGWDRHRLAVEADDESVQIERDGDTFRIVSHDDVVPFSHVPVGAQCH